MGKLWQHVDGTLYTQTGWHGPWLKLVPLARPSAAPLYIAPEFMQYYTEVGLH